MAHIEPKPEETSPDEGERVTPSLRETLERLGRRSLEAARLEKSRELFDSLVGYPGLEEVNVKTSGSERSVARQVIITGPDGQPRTLRVVDTTPTNINNHHEKIAIYTNPPLLTENESFPQSVEPEVWIDTHKYAIDSESDYSYRDLQVAINETVFMDDLTQQIEEASKSPTT